MEDSPRVFHISFCRLRLSAGLAPASVIFTPQPRSHCRRERPKLPHGRSIVGWPSGLLCRAVDTARLIRPAGQPRPAVISVLSIAFSLHSSSFSTVLWPAALSSGQRRWRFPPCGTLPGAVFFTFSFISQPRLLHLRISAPPPPPLPSPAVSQDTKHHGSGAGFGSSAAAQQTFRSSRFGCSAGRSGTRFA